MRFDLSADNVGKNVKEFAPFFVRRVAPCLVIFTFIFSIVLAHCAGTPAEIGVLFGLAFAPVAYLLGVTPVVFARAYIEWIRSSVLSIDPPRTKFFAFNLFPPSFFPPVPTSPPRFCLAGREALACRS